MSEPITPAMVEQKVKAFLKVRDTLAEYEEEYKKKIKEWVDLKSLLEGWFNEFLDRAGPGVTSIKTEHGTVGKSVRYTASVQDGAEFMQHVINNKEWDLLERRANATAVRAWMEQHQTECPGVRITPMRNITVRRPTAKPGKAGDQE